MHLMLHAAQRKQIAVSFFHKIEDKASLSRGKWCALVTVGNYYISKQLDVDKSGQWKEQENRQSFLSLTCIKLTHMHARTPIR